MSINWSILNTSSVVSAASLSIFSTQVKTSNAVTDRLHVWATMCFHIFEFSRVFFFSIVHNRLYNSQDAEHHANTIFFHHA